MKATIPVFRPPIPRAWKGEVEKVMESHWWGYGPGCHALEREFCRTRGGWALATNSCTAALYLVGRRLVEQGHKEVIVPAITFVSTAMAFHQAGLRVSVADVNPDTLTLSVASARAKVRRGTGAIVAVHLFGQRQDLGPLRTLCDERGLSLIEDCAHRLGTKDEAGLADYACFSFNAVKEAPAGEGGMLWGRRIADERECRAASYLGMDVDTFQRSAQRVHRPYAFSAGGGLKLRLNDLSAAFVRACLPEMDTWRASRREVFGDYDRALGLAGGDAQTIRRDYTSDSMLMYVFRVAAAKRDGLRKALAEGGVATSVHYPSLSEHPLWRDQSCPRAELHSREILTLPCYPGLTKTARRKVLEALGQALSRTREWPR